MKSIITISTITVALLFSFHANAETQNNNEATTCALKQSAIQTEIEHAKERNNSNRLRGLQKALDESQTNCSDAKLEIKYKNQIDEKNSEIAKRQQEIKKAELKGDQNKITKLKEKLNEEQDQLIKAKNKLAQFYKEISK